MCLCLYSSNVCRKGEEEWLIRNGQFFKNQNDSTFFNFFCLDRKKNCYTEGMDKLEGFTRTRYTTCFKNGKRGMLRICDWFLKFEGMMVNWSRNGKVC
mmetsp:Transcript_55898/g.67378  ORF Transcript_55898/g.67378 Transcript_55898/m.67378 type:complete len:98 (+) Transcript_55898:64-357(+)